ncbi:MAG TPA: BON domain-containing protein [bacterium]|jgi:osmotically-inducible protein OsmY|nr:BON domain-containing protein [bacterium]
MVFEPYSDPRDVEMEAHVHASLRGMGEHLHVKVRGGVVTLSGIAEDFEEKRQMDTAVKMIGGVRQVINQVRVVSREEHFDNYR